MVAKARQLIVQTPNRVGLLAEIARALANAKVNQQACCCYSMAEQACFMMVVDKYAAAKKALAKAGYSFTEDSVICIEIPNKPGELAKAAAKVSQAGIDMEYAYATAGGRTSLVIVKSKDDTAALKALRKR